MKKTFIAIAIASAAALSLPALAQDTSTPTAASGGNDQSSQALGSGNWFIDINAGRTNGYSQNSGFGSGFGNDSGNLVKNEKGRRTGYSVLGGYRWKAGSDLGLGLEAGYSDLGNYKLSNLGKSGPVDQRTSQNALRGWMVGANGRINVLPQWYVSAHGGYFHANNNNGAYNNSISQDLFHGGNRGGYYAGLGTGWDINEHFGVGVQYDYFHASAGNVHDVPSNSNFAVRRSTGIVSVNAEYRF
jgi:outer membrane immunogenic protein